MDAVRYLKESERMCACCEDCQGCEIKERVGQEDSCIDFESANPESAVAIVEKWSAEHPIRTNAVYVAEKLREIGYTVDIEELRLKCPPHESDWYASYKNEKTCGRKPYGRRPCVTCKAWWDEEREEK